MRAPTTLTSFALPLSGSLASTWNARQEQHMPVLFSPTTGAAINGGVLVLVGAVPDLPFTAADIGHLLDAGSI